MAQSSDNGTDGENLKIPPNSLEAEQSILGGLMLDNTASVSYTHLTLPTKRIV